MVLLIQYTLLFASVLLLVALGGCFSEHNGNGCSGRRTDDALPA